MTTLTPAQQAAQEIEAALANGPTPGPWRLVTKEGTMYMIYTVEAPSRDVICDNECYYPAEVDPKNQQLIAAANPTALRALLDDRQAARYTADVLEQMVADANKRLANMWFHLISARSQTTSGGKYGVCREHIEIALADLSAVEQILTLSKAQGEQP